MTPKLNITSCSIRDIVIYFVLISGFIDYLGQMGLTVSAKFESASKISLYRKAFGIFFAFTFQILVFKVNLVRFGMKIRSCDSRLVPFYSKYIFTNEIKIKLPVTSFALLLFYQITLHVDFRICLTT